MTIIQRIVNGKVYRFHCEYHKTRNGFKHSCLLECHQGEHVDCTIYLPDESTCYYLNRTWERYTFQSVCKQRIYEIIENCKKTALYLHKEKYKVKRLSKEKKEQIWSESEKLKELQAVLDSLN